jgi:hypothetical protein
MAYVPENHGAVVLHGSDLHEETPEVFGREIVAHPVVAGAGHVQQVPVNERTFLTVPWTWHDMFNQPLNTTTLFNSSLNMAVHVLQIFVHSTKCSTGQGQ